MQILPGGQFRRERAETLYRTLFRTLLRTAAYEEYVEGLKAQLEQQRGIRVDVFDSKLPHLIVCMWPAGRRLELRQRASEYDAVLVLGGDAAVKTIQDLMQSSSCRVISGMEVDGIMSVIPSFRFPGNISLEVNSVTRVLEHPSGTADQPVPAVVERCA